MGLRLNKIKKLAVVAIGTLILGLAQASGLATAAGFGITMSPPNEVIILNAGERFTGTFTISNPIDHDADFDYIVTVQPFYVDENYNVYYEDTEGLNQMVDWITTDTTSGVLPVNGIQKINFTINVPEDAPAGGQYAAITVSSNTKDGDRNADGDVGVTMQQNVAMSHIIYAEIAGTTRREGDVIDINIPSLIFDGNLTTESTVKNIGNVHGKVKYITQVFPLFSDEEVFTNEENPEAQLILPNRTITNKTIWDKTPPIGIFNVKYTVEFEGVTTEVNKLVIKCPLWLLFVILFVIIALIIWIVIRIRTHKKSGKRAEVEA